MLSLPFSRWPVRRRDHEPSPLIVADRSRHPRIINTGEVVLPG